MLVPCLCLEIILKYYARFQLAKPQCRNFPIIHEIWGNRWICLFLLRYSHKKFHLLAPLLTRKSKTKMGGALTVRCVIKWQTDSGKWKMVLVRRGTWWDFNFLMHNFLRKSLIKRNSWAICPTKIVNEQNKRRSISKCYLLLPTWVDAVSNRAGWSVKIKIDIKIC